MNLSLNQDSDVPLRQQIAEQIILLITTGELRAGEEMPSVRALARVAKVHHNTVSKAYQQLVQREWLTGRRGAQLVVGASSTRAVEPNSELDELINETIRRAKSLGYPLQTLRNRVRELLLAAPADHILVVEDEPGLRGILKREIEEKLHARVACCSYAEFVKEPAMLVGSQVLAPGHLSASLASYVPVQRPCFCVDYSRAKEHLALIRALKVPSNIAMASVSASLLKTARGVLAPSIGREHTYQEFLLAVDDKTDLRGIDLVFCDSIALPLVSAQRKVHYQLISNSCFEDLSDLLRLEPRERN